MSDRYFAFISHSGQNREWVARLQRNLERCLDHYARTTDPSVSRRVFLDQVDLRSGESWADQLNQAIGNSEKLILVMSAETAMSDWVKFEWQSLLATRPHDIFPIRLAAAEIPTYLRHVQWVDFHNAQGNTYRSRLAQLFGDLLGRSRREPPPIPEDLELLPPPEPSFPNEDARVLSKSLEEAYRKRAEILAGGGDPSEINSAILGIKRQLRHGPQLQPGDFLLDGRFQLLEMIGRGGFSTVWKANDRERNSLAAVKVLHPQYSEDRARRDRFFRGARHMAQLRHPGVVGVLEPRCSDSGFQFFAMEYVAGGDFRELVLRGELSFEERLQIMLEVGGALQFAHEHGVVHRDIKPSNILIDSDGRPRITDFDLVRAADTTGGTRTAMLGTFLYAAPEAMMDGKHASAPADVYGLGMTAIFALYGTDLPADVLWEPSAFIDSLGLSEKLRAVLAKAVARNIESRWSSVAEFILALRDSTMGSHSLSAAGFGEELAPGSLLKTPLPWLPALFSRLQEDRIDLDWTRQSADGRWFLCLNVRRDLGGRFGTAPQIMVLATAKEVRGEDLREAHEELFRREYELDPDLLVVVDGQKNLERRLKRVYQAWGQWVPWPLEGSGFPPLRKQFHKYLSAHDIFEMKDPVRGRQVIGRTGLISEISKRIQQGQAVGIFGLRKVGKTTLVRAVTDKLDPSRRHPNFSPSIGPKDTKALVAWLDVQDLGPRTLESIVGYLVDDLRSRLERVHPATRRDWSNNSSLEELRDLIEELSKDVVVTIVFDEYDLLFDSDHGDPGVEGVENLLRMLRGCSQVNGNLSLVFVGRDCEFLDEPQMGGRPNPMMNWVVRRWLPPMNQEDAYELLRRLGRRVGLDVGRGTASLAYEWTGGHPLLHRQFGSALLELVNSSSLAPESKHIDTDPLCEQAVDLFLDRGEVLTTCRDILYLLDTRYENSSRIFRSLCLATSRAQLVQRLDDQGGWHHPSLRALRNFGLISGTKKEPKIPAFFSWYCRTLAPHA